MRSYGASSAFANASNNNGSLNGEESDIAGDCSDTAEKKQEVIKAFAREEGDTGSPQVQIAILTERINNLTASAP